MGVVHDGPNDIEETIFIPITVIKAPHHNAARKPNLQSMSTRLPISKEMKCVMVAAIQPPKNTKKRSKHTQTNTLVTDAILFHGLTYSV